MKQLTREEFDGTFFDVSEWTDEQKTKFQERCFELGYTWRGQYGTVQELQASRYYLGRCYLTFTNFQYESANHPVQKYYSDMFPEEIQAPTPKLDVISEIVKLVQEREEVSVSEEDERGFDGLVYTEIENGKPSEQYFVIKKRQCSPDQWDYLFNNLQITQGTEQGDEDPTLQICNDGEGWFGNDDISRTDTVISFNDLFKYKEDI